MDPFTEPKPSNQRCQVCWPDGTCDKVAFAFGFCGLAKLVDAIEVGADGTT